MPRLRRATPDDAPLITLQRHQMFADNNLATEARYAEMDLAFEPWVRQRIADGRYVGLFLLEDANQEDRNQEARDQQASAILAACGIFFQDFPPHWMDPKPLRAYLLNFYTVPEARGRGLATQLLHQAIQVCKEKNVGVITLHASPFGKPIYEKFGFAPTNEMILLPAQ